MFALMSFLIAIREERKNECNHALFVRKPSHEAFTFPTFLRFSGETLPGVIRTLFTFLHVPCGVAGEVCNSAPI